MADVGEIIRATAFYTRPFASQIQNVFHWQLVDGAADDSDIVDELEDWFTNDWGAAWAQMASGQITLTEVNIQVVATDGEVLRNLGEPQIGVTGVHAETTLAAATSAYILGNTDVPQIRGSKYIPGMSELEINNGAWTNPALVELGLILIEYLTDVNIGVGGRLLAGVLSKKIVDFQSFNNSGAIEQIPAYQRRRKPQVGE